MQMQMVKFGWNKESLIGLGVSMCIGAPTFIIDIAIIYFCLNKLHLSKQESIAVGFTIAAFFNYAMNRLFVYSNSKQPHEKALILYFLIAFMWLWFTVVTTVFLTNQLHIPIYISRSIVGFIVGTVGYLISSVYTFKMRGNSKE